jgi:hydroxymethylglutaryl-CoA lyase
VTAHASDAPRRVRIREVGPRDGFQNEPETIPTSDKVALINALGRASFTRIELASFVRPDVIPQLSDGVEVLNRIDLPAGVERMVLIPNSKGLDNALKVRDLFDAAAVFVSASQTHNKKNINRTVEETMADVSVMAGRIRAEGIRLSAVIANAYAALLAGCASFESSFGELGGCPVPAGSTGNIATEDLVSMFHEMGVETGLELEKVIDAAQAAQAVLGRKLTSHSIVAGPVIWASPASG